MDVVVVEEDVEMEEEVEMKIEAEAKVEKEEEKDEGESNTTTTSAAEDVPRTELIRLDISVICSGDYSARLPKLPFVNYERFHFLSRRCCLHAALCKDLSLARIKSAGNVPVRNVCI